MKALRLIVSIYISLKDVQQVREKFLSSQESCCLDHQIQLSSGKYYS